MPGHDIIVIGASAGGVEALRTLARTLPPDLPAAVFVVLHIPAEGRSALADILKRSGPLDAVQASDGAEIQPGCIYVAPSDHHLLVERGKVRVIRGPKENRHRPAIDPLFRSAARAYGSRVIGVVLTGSLDDGTAGLLAIKQRGGIAIVQDPDEALYTSMPLSALQHVAVDYTLPLSEIGAALVRLANEQVSGKGDKPMPENIDRETRIVEMAPEMISPGERVGTPSTFSCPECGGVLWELQDGELLRFRCRVGHAFSIDSMFAQQSEAVEEALWVALKTLEESSELSRRMAEQAHQRGQEWLARRFEARLQDSEQHTRVIRQVLMRDEPVVTHDR